MPAAGMPQSFGLGVEAVDEQHQAAQRDDHGLKTAYLSVVK
jgi:hypothetical protein